MTRPFAQLLRLIWIDTRLEIGHVNRSDIMTAFDISQSQAAIDFRTYRAEHPTCIEYDASARHYRRPKKAKPAYPQHLRLTALHVVSALSIFRDSENKKD